MDQATQEAIVAGLAIQLLTEARKMKGLSDQVTEIETNMARINKEITELETELEGAESGSDKNTSRGEENLAGKEIDAEHFRRDIADRLTRMLKAEED